MSSSPAPKRVSPTILNLKSHKRFLAATAAFVLVLSLALTHALAAISLSTTVPAVQTFNGIGTSATAALPTDFRADRISAVRTVGSYAAAGTATTQVGGNSLSTSASNGIYNFGAGAATTASDRAIGFLSSGTATHSGNLYAQYANNTGGTLNGLQISYNVEKYRNGSNSNGFSIQLYYSFNGTTWTPATGFLTSFPGDANNNGFASAPGATVPVSGTLNVNIANGSDFYLAWNYSVTSGTTVTNSQALAVDDINVLGFVTTGPQGTGLATPDSVTAGQQTLLTVTVTPGTFPPSTGLAVQADLTPIGGLPNQQFFDNATNGDQVSGDNVFSYQATVGNVPAGAKNLTALITENEGRPANATISLTVLPPTLAIHDIQGSTGTSPYANSEVITHGIVTARKSNGFFIQTPDIEADTDADAAETSQAIFVFTGSKPTVKVRDGVSVRGRVIEFKRNDDLKPGTLTELGAPLTIQPLSEDNDLPTELSAAILNPAAPGREAQLERYEGMLVNVGTITTVSGSNNFGEFWAVTAGTARPFREPGIEVSSPVPAADEGPYAGSAPPNVPSFDGNYERIMVDGDEILDDAGNRRAGLQLTSFTNVTDIFGPLDYAFDEYRIDLDATASPVVTGGLSGAIAAPARTALEFNISSFNLENFFPPPANPTPAQLTAFNNRLNKASLAIRDVLALPDILGVIEIGDLATLQQLAARINSIAPGAAYQAYLEEATDGGGNDQDVGYLVNTARVEVVETIQFFKGKTFNFNGTDLLLHDRTPLLLRANVLRPGVNQKVPVTVILNHLRSLIEIDAPGNVGARNREKRRLQAEDVADLIQTYENDNLVVMGDLNAFQFNDGYVDVVGTLKGSPAPANEVVEPSLDRWSFTLTDLGDLLPAVQNYSYVHEGSAQVLDHMLVNPQMLDLLTRFVYAHNNPDFPEAFAADPTRPESNSDHDAPVGYFGFPALAELSISKAASNSQPLTGSNVTYTITVTNSGPDAAANVTVTDTIPAGMSFVNCSATGGGTCGGAGNNRTVSYASVAANTTETITITAAVDCALADGTILSNTATVSSSTPELNEDNNSAEVSVTASNPPPTITGLSVDKAVLSPPNHRMVDVAVSYVVTDNCGPVAVDLQVTSNEPDNGLGDGDTANDIEVVNDNLVRLRAERSGHGSGRVYTIAVTATDSFGYTTTSTVTVSVPKGNK
jgi:uncharacterized protein